VRGVAKEPSSGIPFTGGVITIEPTVGKVRFWLRGAVAYLGSGPYFYRRMEKAPMYIVVWNSDRTVEFHREGPYRGAERNRILTGIRTEIDRYGLQEFLFRRHATE
jgi:hypothetical protein